MKKLLTLALTLALVALGSISLAGSNLNSSRSNIYRVTYDTTAVNLTQTAAVLKELDKIGPGANEATVRKLLQKQGVNLSLIKKISILGPLNKLETILILTNSADVPQAIAVSDSATDERGKELK